jgi:hypothetical protein
MKIAFLKASEGDVRERVEQVKKGERLACHFERDVRAVTGEDDPSEYVKTEENPYPDFVAKTLEVKCDERSLAWTRFIFRQIWDNRESQDLLNLDFDGVYASQDAGEAFEATLAVFQKMSEEMNCVIGFNHYDYDEMLENQFYFRPGVEPLTLEDIGFVPVCEGEEVGRSSFDLGFEWQLTIAVDKIKHKKWICPDEEILSESSPRAEESCD